MKVQLTIEFDMPDTPDKPVGILNQILFDAVLGYATISHGKDACTWLAEESKRQTDEEKRRARDIYRMHKTWGEILFNGKMAYKILT